MSKRFLISEDERNSILSLYAKKGIILEQEYTKGVIPKNTGEGIYNLGGYELEVDSNQNIKVFDRYMDNDKFIGEFSGRFSDLKYDLKTNSFADSNKVLSANNPLLQKMLPNIREKQTPSNNLGYFVALNEKNKFPTLYALTPIVVKQEQEIPVVDSTVIGLNQSYIPTKQTYGYMKDEILKAAKGDEKKYSDLNLRQFRREYAISLNTIAGPEGDGLYQPPIPPMPVNIAIKLDIENPFVFDTTDLEGNGNKDLEKFISNVKRQKEIHGEEIYNDFINFLNNTKGGLLVTTSSSIDDDPEGITAYSNNPLTGTLESCRKPGGRPRKEYNQCLSEKRAKVILQKLNTYLPEITNFKANPIGETDQFDEGKKWPNVKGTKKERSAQTVKNRRLVINLPTYTKN